MDIYELEPGRSALADAWENLATAQFIARLIEHFAVPDKLPVAEAGPRKLTLLPQIRDRECVIIDRDKENLTQICRDFPHVKPLNRDFKFLPDKIGPLGAGSLGTLVWNKQLIFYLFEYARLENLDPEEWVEKTVQNLLSLVANHGIFVEIAPGSYFAARQIGLLERVTRNLGKSTAKLWCIPNAERPDVYVLSGV